MHVLQVISGGGKPNGALLYAIRLSHALADRGVRVTVATPPGGYVTRHLDRTRVDVFATELDRWPATELRRVHGYVEHQGVDVFHTHCSRAHAFGVLLRRLYGGRCVATAHSTTRQLHWCANDFVIACSEATRRYQIRANFVPPWRIRTNHLPIDSTRFCPLQPSEVAAVRRRLSLDPARPLVGILGDIIPRKGQWFAVRALREIVRAVPDAQLVLVGNPDSAYERLIRRAAVDGGVSGSLVLRDFQADPENVLGALDLCLCPSLKEPFGLTAAEALATGVPVVASRVGGLPETVVHGETGLLVRPGRPGELAQAVIAILSDRSLARRLAEAGRQRVLENFTPERHYEQTIDLLQQVASTRRKRCVSGAFGSRFHSLAKVR